jgi:hypothetical protein
VSSRDCFFRGGESRRSDDKGRAPSMRLHRLFLVALIVMVGNTAKVDAKGIDQQEKESVAGTKHATTEPGAIVSEQNFEWNDELGSGEYVWGDGNFLKMDGSVGRIACSRRLKHAIQDDKSRIEIRATFSLGKMYRIVLYDLSGRIVMDAHIGRDDRLLFEKAGAPVDLGIYLGRETDSWRQKFGGSERIMREASALHTFGFGQFDFKSRTFTFTFDGKEFPNTPLDSQAGSVNRLALETEAVEPGEVIWVDHFKQISQNNDVIDDERFDHNWVAVPEVKAGYPSDKWHATTYRPKDYQSLEVRTVYGAVYCKFSDKPIPKGTVELEVKTDNVDNEIQLTLGEYKYEALGPPGNIPVDNTGMAMISGGWQFYVGIFAGVWTPFQDPIENKSPTIEAPYGTFVPFANAPPAVVNRPYRLKLEWNSTTGIYHLWIDDVLQTYKGSPDIHTSKPAVEGINMITIHPGNRNPWVGPYLYSRWGKIKITAQ